MSIEKLTHKLIAEGVKRIIICAEEPQRHNKRALAKGTTLWHRDRLDEAQKTLREVKGLTVLIYDQHCAAVLGFLSTSVPGSTVKPARRNTIKAKTVTALSRLSASCNEGFRGCPP